MLQEAEIGVRNLSMHPKFFMLCHCSVLAVVLRLNFTKKKRWKGENISLRFIGKIGQIMLSACPWPRPWVVTHFLVNQQMILPWLRFPCSGIYVHNRTRRRGERGIWEETARRDLKRARQDTRTRIWRVNSPPWRCELRCLSIWVQEMLGMVCGHRQRPPSAAWWKRPPFHSHFARIASLPLFYSSSSSPPLSSKISRDKSSERAV